MEMRRAVHLRPDHTTALWLLTGGTMVFDGDIMVLDNYLIYHGTLRHNLTNIVLLPSLVLGGNCLVGYCVTY